MPFPPFPPYSPYDDYPYVATPLEQQDFAVRQAGSARPGYVTLRDFDQGIVQTLGATVSNNAYYVQALNVSGPPGWPGVPVVFSYPEDVLQEYRLPFVLVRRDDITPAMERWQSVGALEYAVPGYGALPKQVTGPGGVVAQGFTLTETRPQAIPYDISYTLEITARHRGAIGQRNQINSILYHVLRRFPVYGQVQLTDSIGDPRSYECLMEGVSPLDNIAEVTDRKLGFSISLRVLAELDTTPTSTSNTVTQLLAPTYTNNSKYSNNT